MKKKKKDKQKRASTETSFMHFMKCFLKKNAVTNNIEANSWRLKGALMAVCGKLDRYKLRSFLKKKLIQKKKKNTKQNKKVTILKVLDSHKMHGA